MISFVRIPLQHAPIGGALSYGVETDAAAIGIRILRCGPDDAAAGGGPPESAAVRSVSGDRTDGRAVAASVAASVAAAPAAGGGAAADSSSGGAGGASEALLGDSSAELSEAGPTLLGAKRFVGVERVLCDVAPCVRAAVRFEPTTGATGFRPAGDRLVAVAVEAFAIGAAADRSGAAAPASARAGSELQPEGAFAAAPERSFLPCAEAVAAPALLTSMPRERLIAPGESDELTLLADEPLAVTVAATRPDGGREVRTYRSATAGLQLFRFDARDFPGAERATVDAGPCGAVAYSLLPAPEGAQRLAWRTAEGSVEHYTFPIVRTRRVRVDRERVRGPEGIRSAAVRTERSTTVESAYESSAMLGALAGLLAAPQAWAAEPEGYRPVDIVTGEAVVHRHGTLSSFEATFRSAAETPQPWN